MHCVSRLGAAGLWEETSASTSTSFPGPPPIPSAFILPHPPQLPPPPPAPSPPPSPPSPPHPTRPHQLSALIVSRRFSPSQGGAHSTGRARYGRGSHDCPETVEEDSETAQERSKTPKMASRRPKRPPRRSKRTRKAPSKRAPKVKIQ